MSAVVKNVKELMDALAKMDPELPVVGYDGTDRDCPVMVYVHDFSECADDDRKQPRCVINVD